MLRLLALALFFVPFTADAQAPPIRWGALSDAETALDAWPDDPDAKAVVLGDVGFSEVRLTRARGVTYRLRRHVRVKVLEEGGYDLGEFSLRYRNHRATSVRGVRGQTFVPDGAGGYDRVGLDGDDIFDEEVSEDTREVRFSMPALAPGAIFEYEYTYETDGIALLPRWTFQTSEPTVVSELRFESPDYFQFLPLTQGSRIEAGETRTVNTRLGYPASEYRWAARDVPALRPEPYTTTEADHVERIDFQLRQVNWPGEPFERVLSSWPEVAEDFWANPAFGGHLGGSRRVRALAAEVEGAPAERARALYDMLRTEYVWDGRGGVFASRGMDEVIETKTGSEAELTILLLALLDAADVPAVPVLTSSRSNGRAVPTYPVVRQFDTILALVMLPGEPPALLAPLSANRPYGEIPVYALNRDGWMVDREDPQWITYGAPAGTGTTAAVRLTLADDGALAGALQLRLSGYDAFDAREALAEAAAGPPAAAGEAVESAADAGAEVEVSDVVVTGADTPEEPLRIEAAVAAPAAEVVGDEMYLTPFVAMQLDENPFERETRAFPVDFAYPFTRTYLADVTLPEGWEPVDLPDPVQITIPSRTVSYVRTIGARPGGLQVRAVLTVAGVEVSPEEYPALRDLYDEIVAAETEAVVIARSAAAPAPAAADTSEDR